MKNFTKFGALLLSLGAFHISRAHSQPAIVDGAFSTPNYVGTSPGWAYLNGSYGGWNFVSGADVGNSGISDNVNGWFVGTPPVGDQAAFLQVGGIISQTIGSLVPGQDYQITLYAAERGGYNSDPFYVEANGIPILSATPESTSFVNYASSVFYSPTSSMVLSINGVYNNCTPYSWSCDWDSAFNDVVISPVSSSSVSGTSASIEIDEPSGFAIFAAGSDIIR